MAIASVSYMKLGFHGDFKRGLKYLTLRCTISSFFLKMITFTLLNSLYKHFNTFKLVNELGSVKLIKVSPNQIW